MQIKELHSYLAERIASSNYIVSIEKEAAIEILSYLEPFKINKADLYSELTKTESVIYSVLVSADGDTVTSRKLMMTTDFSSVATLHVYIGRLRNAIRRLGWNCTIETVRGRGYRLVEGVAGIRADRVKGKRNDDSGKDT